MTAPAVLRYSVTAALAGLTAAYAYYPGVLWIPVAIAVLGTLGVHVVPAAAGAPPPGPPPASPQEPGAAARQ